MWLIAENVQQRKEMATKIYEIIKEYKTNNDNK